MAEAGTPWQLVLEKVEQRCGYLLASEQWSDCTFVVGSESNQAVVPAHKLILAMASPVFEAMFYGGLSEPNEPIVPIPDVQPEAFKALLQYVYTDNITIDSFDMAWDLWYGANKYMLPHLVKKCRSYICSVVCPSNVCRTYEFALLFDEESLIDKCIQIISRNTKEVLNDSSFEDVESNTLMAVLSLDHLNVDSELDLIHAVVRYAKAEQRRQGQISPPVSEKLSGVRLEPGTSGETVPSVESSPRMSPPAELDTKTSAEVVLTSEPKVETEHFKDKPTIRAAIEKIRFLSLTPRQFAESQECCDLLTESESFAIIMNIASTASIKPMPAGFSDCRGRRQPRCDSVDQKPKTKPLVDPSAESHAATKLTTPAEIVQGLRSSLNLYTMKAAARAVREMLSKNTTDPLIHSQLVEAGVVPPLVAALDQPCPDIRLDVAWALTNIAADTREHTLAVVDGGAIPKLVTLLGHGGEMAAQAAWALGNIAADGPVTRDAVLNLGALQAMLPLLHPYTPVTQLRRYVRAYNNMCGHKNPTVRFQLVSPALRRISELLVLTDQEVLAEVCSALSSLTDGQTDRIGSLHATPGLTVRLTALLGHPAPKVQNHALRLIGNMLTGTDVQTDRCLEAGCLDHIINFLQCGEARRVKEAAWAASNILAGTPAQIQRALDKQILEPLSNVLAEGDAGSQNEAAWAISNLCLNGTAQQLGVLVSARSLEPFCLLLATPENRPLLPILEGLTKLLQKVGQNTRLEVCVNLREIGVPHILTTLQQHEGERIRLEASRLMRTYFPGAVPADNAQGR